MAAQRKLITLILTLLISIPVIHARGVVDSGGVNPHPVISTMNLVVPQAGVDYPTDRARPEGMEVVLNLLNKRIPIFDDIALLEYASAGIDYPTDMRAPFWTKFQKVLTFENGTRVPIRLSFIFNELFWIIKDHKVKVSEILEIRKSVAGIDYPTDGPARLSRNFFVMILKTGERLRL